MKRKLTFRTTLISPLLFISASLLAYNSYQQDTCAVNDFCETALSIDSVFAGGDIVCHEGCTRPFSSPLRNM